jgi:HEPN domain-containing protein
VCDHRLLDRRARFLACQYPGRSWQNRLSRIADGKIDGERFASEGAPVSTPAFTRHDFHQLADIRLKEAKALLDLGMWDGAYYLAGYAIEVALKACIIKTVVATEASFLFQDKKYAEKCWTHDLEKLIELSEMKPALDIAINADSGLSDNWATAKDWKEDKRYHRITEKEAKDLYDAVSDASHGVLPWIKSQW